MSTTAIIQVPGACASLYKHYDGYPSATLPWLTRFNREFTDNRGVDPEYKLAKLIRSSVALADEFDLDKSTVTGWGVVGPGDFGDYTYRLEDDGAVTVIDD